MQRLALSMVFCALAGCTTAERGERCNPLEFSPNGIQGNCTEGLACVYPTGYSAPPPGPTTFGPMANLNCGVSYCCTVDKTGNITDKHPNCQPDPDSIAACMIDLGTALTDAGTDG
jgi:hypothetical protein